MDIDVVSTPSGDVVADKAVEQSNVDVTTEEVLDRIKATFKPISGDFMNAINGHTDVIGPFWICATIVILLQLTTPIVTDEFRVSTLPISILTVYAFGFGVPIILAYSLKFLGAADIGIGMLLSLFGYSLVVLIPITPLCLIPVTAIKVLLMIYAFMNSTILILWNIQEDIQRCDQTRKYIMGGVIISGQVGIYLTYGLMFI